MTDIVDITRHTRRRAQINERAPREYACSHARAPACTDTYIKPYFIPVYHVPICVYTWGCANIDREWKLSMRCLSSKTSFFQREGDYSRVRDATKAPGFFVLRCGVWEISAGNVGGEYARRTAYIAALYSRTLISNRYDSRRSAIAKFFVSLTSLRKHSV